MLKDKNILITGSTGSLGTALIPQLSESHLIIYSRDEYKQYCLKQKYPKCRYIIGDVRDYDRLYEACHEVDIIIHCAALKHVDVYQQGNITEACQTNINGASNVIKAARELKIHQVWNISTDKAVEPTSVYGATKAIAERAFLDAGHNIIRFGNIVDSRGAFIWYLRDRIKKKLPIVITDAHMTRFWVELKEAAQFVVNRVQVQTVEESSIFIPIMPSFKLKDLVESMWIRYYEEIGPRMGEKMHEVLFTENNGYALIEGENAYIVNDFITRKGKRYDSLTNDHYMDIKQIKARLRRILK